MSLKIRRSDWFIGDLEHYAAWYQSEASWEVAQRYLRAVSSTSPSWQTCPISDVRRGSQPCICVISEFIQRSARLKST